MKNFINPVYHKAYDMLLARLRATQQNALADSIEAGNTPISTAKYLLKRQISLATNNVFTDLDQNRQVGLSSFKDGRFPNKAQIAISHIGLSYGSHASEDNPLLIRNYSNFLKDSAVVGEVTVNTRNYPVDTIVVPNALLSSEVTVKFGTVTVLNREPVASFFKDTKYATDEIAKTGRISPENAMELLTPISCSSENAPELSFLWPTGVAFPAGTHFIEFVAHGVQIVTS